jgi:hypothetical protein
MKWKIKTERFRSARIGLESVKKGISIDHESVEGNGLEKIPSLYQLFSDCQQQKRKPEGSRFSPEESRRTDRIGMRRRAA